MSEQAEAKSSPTLLARFRALRWAAIAIVGAAWVVLLRVTTTSREDDPSESPLFWWGWVVLPSIAALGTALRIERSAVAWAVALVGPSALWTAIGGTVLHDPDHGASLWIVGEIFAIFLAGFVLAGSAVGDVLGVVIRRRTSPRCPACRGIVERDARFCVDCGARLT